MIPSSSDEQDNRIEWLCDLDNVYDVSYIVLKTPSISADKADRR